jgi:hypothetical protein
MRNKLTIIIVITCLLLLTIFHLRPYNNVEFNAATVYYQSYSQLNRNISQYVGLLENYSNTEEEIYLEKALIKLDNVMDNLTIFKLINQIDFRDTFLNEKVVKPEFFSIENLEQFESNYHYSVDILKLYLEENVLENSSFEDFVYYNQLILNGLTTKEVGYNPEKKEFRVVLDESKKTMFEKGLNGLREIVREVITPN